MTHLAEHAVQRFVLNHELIQENFKGVDPHGDGGLPPIPLLLSHGLLQNMLKQGVQVFVADALAIVHLWGSTSGVGWGGVKARAGTADQAPGGRSVKDTFELGLGLLTASAVE